MSQPSRPRTRGPAERRRRTYLIDRVNLLEDRQLLAPVLPLFPRQATLGTTVTTGTAPNQLITAPVIVTQGGTTTAQAGFPSPAPLVSVSQFAPASVFGGDIVRIRSGPGGAFGNGVYAVSRGAGANAGNAIDRPGVIYRLDPATGKAAVFFDLNTLVKQLEPGTGATAGNSVSGASGLVNWYDIAFDPEGYFDGKASMFVASVDRSDPAKNAVYRIAPDGTFLGAFANFNDGAASLRFTSNPTAILVPPTEQQSFLRGLFVGSGTGASTVGQTTFSAFFFNANQYRPGQNVVANLPFGITPTSLTLGPQTALVSANIDYLSPVYSTFTDFGTPSGGGIGAQPGLSGVQGLNGDLLINQGRFPLATDVTSGVVDRTPAISTDFRRFQDAAFDYYGYFSQGLTLTASTATGTTTGGTTQGGTTTGGTTATAAPGSIAINTLAFAGSLFVADLGTGLSVALTAPGATIPTLIPVQGSGSASIQTSAGGIGVSAPGGNLGGRIVRITPGGVVTDFAENFNTSGNLDSSSFQQSSLSITFSADGTTLYASDNEGIWQFKTVASLAGSTSGSIVGLNDLRTLGVPYSGQNSAVAVIDSGVDARNPNFRGRVSPGTNLFTGGPGNADTSPGSGGGTGTTGAGGTALPTTNDGHGTPVAGVIAQFVPQTTIVPINIFAPFLAESSTTTTTGGGTGGTTTATTSSNTLSTNQLFYQSLDYVAKHPYVKDPVRPAVYNRVIATNMGFGSTNTFNSEGVAYRLFPQVVISLKNQMTQLRRRGIAPIAAAGQFGAPFAAGTGGATTGASGGNPTGVDNSQNASVGDTQGMSLPAILNEVTSVTGSIPFPFVTGPDAPPTNPTQGTFPSPTTFGPVLLFGFGTTIGSLGGAAATAASGTLSNNNLPALTAGNAPFIASSTGGQGGGGQGGQGGQGGGSTTGTSASTLFSDELLAAANRGVTTDYAAPAIDIPTFRRPFAGNGGENNAFQLGGTSLSSAIVTGSFALVSSALQYWTNLNKTGTTADAYLNQPVGSSVLNFGPHSFKDLSSYNNPDGINSILEWTSVPIADVNSGLTLSTPQLPKGSTAPTNYSRISVSNAVAAIEGQLAIQYLIKHKTFDIIDTNHNGLITAQEIQNFVDNSKTMGLPEAGAMARLLGGTARIASNSQTFAGETPDQPDALQRRFNFFDYAAHGQLNGVISLIDIKNLAHTLLPSPTAFTVVNRARSSIVHYLLDPASARNYQALQHIQPDYQFVPKSDVAKYKGVSPAAFGVQRNQSPSGSFTPLYTLFDKAPGSVSVTTPTAAAPPVATKPAAAQTLSAAGTSDTVATGPATPTTPATTDIAHTSVAVAPDPKTQTAAPAGTTSPLLQTVTKILSDGSATPAGTLAPASDPATATKTDVSTSVSTSTTTLKTTLPPATPIVATSTIPSATAPASQTVTHSQAAAPVKAVAKSKSKGLFGSFFGSISNAFKKI